jgi:signal transduction histidine kinase/CheY-like chemotaxis protein
MLLVYALVLLFIGGIAAVKQYSAFNGGETPAFIDLTQGAAFARLGFDPGDITNTPDTSGGWIDYYADGSKPGSKSLRLHNTGLVTVPKWNAALPLLAKENIEFTNLIEVNVPPEQAAYLRENDAILGLFLGEISDNWEIYLNGKLVKSEWHVVDNEITTHRTRSNLIIPLKPELIREGQNFFAFRIIGNENASMTGFSEVSPYYIEEYDTAKSHHNDIDLVLIAGIYLMVGLYHFITFALTPGEKIHLFYACASALSAVYIFSSTPYAYGLIPNSYATSLMSMLSTYMMVPFFGFFLERAAYPAEKLGLINRLYMVFCVIISVITCFALPQLSPLWGVVTIVYMVCHFSIKELGKFIKEAKALGTIHVLTETLLGGVVICCATVTVCGIIDIVAVVTYTPLLMLTNYSLLMYIICMAFSLARQSAQVSDSLTTSNEELEAAVEYRTHELLLQTEIAQEANTAKSAFLAKMSHEIRTPMNAITGISELILREAVSPTVREYATDVKNAGTNLLSIINDILDFSKIESGKMDIVTTEYLLASLINDVIAIIRIRLVDKPIEFTVSIDSKLPNVLVGDEVRIRQILLNMLTNAVKYTNEGFVQLKISGEWEPDTAPENAHRVMMIFEITDSGIGIKEEDLDKLFGDFVQFDAKLNKNIEGTGLGLAITKKLCNAMGGDVSVSSHYGSGSTFVAFFMQEVKSYTPIAAVDKAAELKVLVYKSSDIHSNSLSAALDNLGVQNDIISTDEELAEELRDSKYNYLFMNFQRYDRLLPRLENYAGTIVIINEYSNLNLSPNMRSIQYPVHAIAIANVLNNLEEDEGYNNEAKTAKIRFIAPMARILLVDDITTNLKVAEGLMSPYSMQITTCLSGAEAIRLVRENAFDIIFMDHMMPEMDGVEATERIRALEGDYFLNVPIIALTANAVSGMSEMFLANGFSDYLAKPIEVPKLNEILEKWVPKEKREKAVIKLETDTEAVDFEIEGVDTKRGLAMSGGSVNAYREILSIFCRDAEERFGILWKVPGEAELQLFITNVHAIKSAAANIGAAQVSEQAALLEAAGKRGDISAIEARLDDFAKILASLLEHITAVLSRKKQRAGKRCRPGDEEALKKLKQALETENISAADEIVDELNDKAGEALWLNDISTFILMSEYEKAVELINALLA